MTKGSALGPNQPRVNINATRRVTNAKGMPLTNSTSSMMNMTSVPYSTPSAERSNMIYPDLRRIRLKTRMANCIVIAINTRNRKARSKVG